MDLTSMLNTAAPRPGMEDHKRRVSGESISADPVQTPPATVVGSSTAPSMVSTPQSEMTASRQASEPRVPNRSRTPWDADGYSMPLASDKSAAARAPQGQISLGSTGLSGCTDLLTPPESMELGISASTGNVNGSPKSVSPKHKFSDSRSSFSSCYTNQSSTASVSHSRISSLSTVSENQPLAGSVPDFSLQETLMSDSSSSCCTVQPLPEHQYQQQQHSAITRDRSEDQDSQPQSPTPVRSRHNLPFETSPQQSPKSADKIRSPSDAVMIPRFGYPESSPSETSPFRGTTRLQIPATHSNSPSRDGFLQQDISPTRQHKRAASAPDFPSITGTTFNSRFPTFGPIPEPTPSPSQHSDSNMEQDQPSQASFGGPARPDADNPLTVSSSNTGLTPTSNVSDQIVGSPMVISPVANSSHQHHSHPMPEASQTTADDSMETGSDGAVDFEAGAVCMYRGDCQTGSQLRKAISHIFGRNKLCTRMIPTSVWVHYCRKHYQRTRYRNGGEYPQRQIGLVKVQIQRVHAWSESNKRKIQGPVLKDWSLSVRKREQLRLDSKMATTGKKRPFQDNAEDDEEDGFDDDRSDMSGTAVPDWIVARIGDGYSTVDILSIVEHLKMDIDQGRLQQIPDIEILPNIVTDSTGNDDTSSGNGASKKNYPKRRSVGGRANSIGPGHRRSQSVNTSALRTDSAPMVRRRSQPNNFLAPALGMPPQRLMNVNELPPSEKRQRVDNEVVMDYRGPVGGHGPFETYPVMSAGGSNVPRPNLGGRVQLAHRPAFGGIRESRAESQAYPYADQRPPFEAQYHNQPPQHMEAGNYHHSQVGPQQPTPTSTTGFYGDVGHFRGNTTTSYEYEQRNGYDHHRGHSGSAGYDLLPAPNPQRMAGPPVVQQLETSSYVLNSAASRRGGMHQRSQSEAGFLHHTPMQSRNSRPTSSAGLPPLSGGNGRPIESLRGGPQGSFTFQGVSGHPGEGQRSQQYGGLSDTRLQHGSQIPEERHGSVSGQSPYVHQAGGNSDKFESVRLPPLQSIQGQTFGNGNQAARQLAGISSYPSSTRHLRHQSSPAVTRMLPTPMEVGTFPGPGQSGPAAADGY